MRMLWAILFVLMKKNGNSKETVNYVTGDDIAVKKQTAYLRL